MNMTIGIAAQEAEALGARWTVAEIAQQPDTLRQTHKVLEAQAGALDDFLSPLFAGPSLRIVLAGAGTSAFIGESLAPLLSAATGRAVEAVATTDIVSAPQLCLASARPTLMVSFGRSGNSPESVAAIEIADQLLDQVHHLVITCNADGALARYAARSARAHAIILPDATHDRSFAMTSSFTAMLYAAIVALGAGDQVPVEAVAGAMAAMRDDHAALARALAADGFERAVYLGSGGLLGIARESALKLLEMTDGQTPSMYDTPLGFRHGPKAFLNGRTLVVLFVSNDRHTRRYDLDLLAELAREGTAARVIALAAAPVDGFAAAGQVLAEGLAGASDLALLFPYVLFAQMVGVHQAIRLGKTPDDPNPSGIVNRVVQGVRIHALA